MYIYLHQHLTIAGHREFNQRHKILRNEELPILSPLINQLNNFSSPLFKLKILQGHLRVIIKILFWTLLCFSSVFISAFSRIIYLNIFWHWNYYLRLPTLQTFTSLLPSINVGIDWSLTHYSSIYYWYRNFSYLLPLGLKLVKYVTMSLTWEHNHLKSSQEVILDSSYPFWISLWNCYEFVALAFISIQSVGLYFNRNLHQFSMFLFEVCHIYIWE